MGWFNKRKEDELPELPTFKSGDEDYLALDSLPDIPVKQEYKSLPQIKPIYKEEPHTIKKTVIIDPQPSKTIIIDNQPQINRNPGAHTRSLDSNKEMIPSIQEDNSLMKTKEPIYIRLDKFEVTLSSFKDIKRKIKEVEEYLGKLKEIKEKEEKELDEWEQELQLIKTKIDAIDKNIFYKLG